MDDIRNDLAKLRQLKQFFMSHLHESVLTSDDFRTYSEMRNKITDNWSHDFTREEDFNEYAIESCPKEELFKLANQGRLSQNTINKLLIWSDDADEVRFWLNHHANPAAFNSSCIHGPSEWATREHIQLMVEAGADVTVDNYKCLTSALRHGNIEVADYLYSVIRDN